MKYSRYFGSQFPDQLLELRTFKDVDATVLGLVNQIKTYQLAGDFANAKALIDANATVLAQYMLSPEYINLLDEETRNLEIYAKGNSQSVFYQNEMPLEESSTGDVWIGA